MIAYSNFIAIEAKQYSILILDLFVGVILLLIIVKIFMLVVQKQQLTANLYFIIIINLTNLMLALSIKPRRSIITLIIFLI